MSSSCTGMTAGATGAFIGTPAEISLIRMTSDGRSVLVFTVLSNRVELKLLSVCASLRLPPSQQRGYKHVFDALGRIAREEGVLTLWRVGSTFLGL